VNYLIENGDRDETRTMHTVSQKLLLLLTTNVFLASTTEIPYNIRHYQILLYMSKIQNMHYISQE